MILILYTVCRVMIDKNVLALVRAGNARGGVALATACVLGASAASVAGAFALAEGLRRVLVADPRAPWWPLLLAVIALVARGLLLGARDVVSVTIGCRAARQLRNRILEQLVRLGPGYTTKARRGSVHVSAVDGCEHVKGYLGHYLPQAAAAIVVPTVLVGILLFIDPLVALVVAVCVMAVPLGQRLVSKMLGERATKHWDQYETYADKLADSVAGMATLVGLGAQRRRRDALQREGELLREQTTANMRVSLSTYVLTGSAMLLGTAGATVLAAWHAYTGRIDAAAVLVVLFLAGECFRPLQDLANYWHEGFYGIAAARSIRTLLDTEPVVDDRGTRRCPDEPCALQLDDVTFHHDPDLPPALANVSVTVPAGKVTALVGASGAGKTTLASLVLRDMDPDSGSITVVDPRGERSDLKELALDDWRRASSRVSQDVVLFSGSILHNVRLANPDADDATVAAALDEARVTEFAERLPDGLDTDVGEGGARLSGGERQRVALARALVRRTPFMMLDEVTSALDGENEALITAALDRYAGKITMLVIAHRLSTVARADHIIVVEQGRVVESGSPADLARTDGAWSRLLDSHRVPKAVAA